MAGTRLHACSNCILPILPFPTTEIHLLGIINDFDNLAAKLGKVRIIVLDLVLVGDTLSARPFTEVPAWTLREGHSGPTPVAIRTPIGCEHVLVTSDPRVGPKAIVEPAVVDRLSGLVAAVNVVAESIIVLVPVSQFLVLNQLECLVGGAYIMLQAVLGVPGAHAAAAALPSAATSCIAPTLDDDLEARLATKWSNRFLLCRRTGVGGNDLVLDAAMNTDVELNDVGYEVDFATPFPWMNNIGGDCWISATLAGVVSARLGRIKHLLLKRIISAGVGGENGSVALCFRLGGLVLSSERIEKVHLLRHNTKLLFSANKRQKSSYSKVGLDLVATDTGAGTSSSNSGDHEKDEGRCKLHFEHLLEYCTLRKE